MRRLGIVLGLSALLFHCDPQSERVFSGQVPLAKGATVRVSGLTLAFPKGLSNQNVQVQISKQSSLPLIRGTADQMAAVKQLRLAGPVFQISASQRQFPGSVYLTLPFDPKAFDNLRPEEVLQVGSVSDEGVLTFPPVLSSDLRKGLITIQTTHFSYFAVFAAHPVVLSAFIIGMAVPIHAALVNLDAQKNPWQFIEPNHPSIETYIAKNQTRLPAVRNSSTGFSMEGFNKTFTGTRDPWLYKRPYSGSETLSQTSVLCWDLANLYGSILAKMAQNPQVTGIFAEKMRFVKGTALDAKTQENILHTWIEIVIDEKAYGVDTASLAPFRFIPLDQAYRDSGLKPTQMFDLNPNSMRGYNSQAPWYSKYLAPPLTAQERQMLDNRRAQLFMELLQIPDSPGNEPRKKAIVEEMKKISQRLND